MEKWMGQTRSLLSKITASNFEKLLQQLLSSLSSLNQASILVGLIFDIAVKQTGIFQDVHANLIAALAGQNVQLLLAIGDIKEKDGVFFFQERANPDALSETPTVDGQVFFSSKKEALKRPQALTHILAITNTVSSDRLEQAQGNPSQAVGLAPFLGKLFDKGLLGASFVGRGVSVLLAGRLQATTDGQKVNTEEQPSYIAAVTLIKSIGARWNFKDAASLKAHMDVLRFSVKNDLLPKRLKFMTEDLLSESKEWPSEPTLEPTKLDFGEAETAEQVPEESAAEKKEEPKVPKWVPKRKIQPVEPPADVIAAEEPQVAEPTEDKPAEARTAEPSESAVVLPPPMPLQDAWVMWYTSNKYQQKCSWNEGIKELCKFDTVQNFWSLFNNLLEPSTLPNKASYFLFRNGVFPEWEDKANREGGTWGFECKPSDTMGLNRYWLLTVLSVIGGAFPHSEEIMGVVVSVRSRGHRLQLWTANFHAREKQKEIGQFWKKTLDLPTKIGFQCNKTQHGKNAPVAMEV
jgi:translation initiation factor 4E